MTPPLFVPPNRHHHLALRIAFSAPQPPLKPEHQVLRLELEVRQSGGMDQRIVPARRALDADEIARPEILDASCVEGNHAPPRTIGELYLTNGRQGSRRIPK
jgi:hypothetical protein